MKKKPSKDIILYHETRKKQCSMCEIPEPSFITNSAMLIKKFYHPQIESYNFRSLNDIIFGMFIL